jgi:transglutaminase-like putative cysteine protease
MNLIMASNNMVNYLKKDAVIDCDHPEIVTISMRMRDSVTSDVDLVKRLYEFVRDEIAHSADIGGKMVTCRASDVLRAGEGICYAKSHLLAALCRASHIPAGFGYQLLRLDDVHSALVLHGLSAVYIESMQKWIRLDARGNKPGVNAQFSINEEMLAFPVRKKLGEADDPMVYPAPAPVVIDTLARCGTFEDLWANLPRKLPY